MPVEVVPIEWTATATISFPCCELPVAIARRFKLLPNVDVKQLKWKGVACPGCQATYEVSMDIERTRDREVARQPAPRTGREREKEW